MALFACVAAGGAAGALARWGLSLWFAGHTRGPFPWGTFTVNLLGCLILGALTGLALRRGLLAPLLQVALSTGFVGAFTTFSTFNLETLQLLQERPLLAVAYVLSSVLLGLGTLWMGLRLAGA